jgi:murein DD-endopeptidase MepM/ murein hydrolase activator NlpD
VNAAAIATTLVPRPAPVVGPAAAPVVASSAAPGVPGATPARPVTQWRWPLLVAPRVVRGFQPPPQRWLAGHRGVDLAAVPGDTVVAAGAGIVTFAGPLAGRGVVTVTHGVLRTTYEPVTATVEVGDAVSAGDPIGVIAAGASHCGGYPSCLHWGLLQGDVYLDPLLLLGVSHPILLPIPH